MLFLRKRISSKVFAARSHSQRRAAGIRGNVVRRPRKFGVEGARPIQLMPGAQYKMGLRCTREVVAFRAAVQLVIRHEGDLGLDSSVLS